MIKYYLTKPVEGPGADKVNKEYAPYFGMAPRFTVEQLARTQKTNKVTALSRLRDWLIDGRAKVSI